MNLADSDLNSIAKLITVVIPCHNYARFLGECLGSVFGAIFRDDRGFFSSAEKVRIIVIDDSSDDHPEFVVDKFRENGMPVEFARVNIRDVHKVRRHGLSLVRSKYVLFLDADNLLPQTFMNEAVRYLEENRNAAFMFPVLRAYQNGGSLKYVHETDKAPLEITWKDIESRNFCDAGSVHRTEVLRQSLALNADVSTKCIAADWRMARTVLRSGQWKAKKSTVPLLYRIHSDQMSANESMDRSYWADADLEHETVTIIVAFSGRWECWWKLREWILGQEWSANQTRLMILNSTHENLTLNQLGLGDWSGAGIQIERIDVGRPNLADEDRRTSDEIREDVEAAVSGLYNRAIQMAFGEYLFFLEDDVIPRRPDAIRELFKFMNTDVVAVSGLYQHRYQENAVSFQIPFTGEMYPMNGQSVEIVGGTGFGCLLARRSILIQFPLSGDDPKNPHYDVAFAAKVWDLGMTWILNRDVKCDHLVNLDDDFGGNTDHSPEILEHLGSMPMAQIRNNVTSKCQHLGPLVETNNCLCGAQIDIFHCNRQNMNAVRYWVDEERELERRLSSPAEKVTPRELKQILAVCEKCPLFVT